MHLVFFFSSRRRHTSSDRDWSSDVCSSDLIYQPMTGDGTIVARVASVQNTNSWTKAGVMIRESLAPGATNAFMFLAASKGLNYRSEERRVGKEYGSRGGGDSHHKTAEGSLE